MPISNPPSNILLQKIAPPALRALAPHLTKVPLDRGNIVRPGETMQTIWFPESGLVSSVVRGPAGKGAEAGMNGYEGFTAPSLVAGVQDAHTELMVQVAGEAFAIDTEVLHRVVKDDARFHFVLLKFFAKLQIQSTQSILTFANAKLEERLARWLLMVRDRARKLRFELTHEFMALMLGTRRAGVTVALHELEGKALVKSERGVLTIIDQEGLEELAGAFYGVAEAEYRRIMETNAF